MHLAFATNVTRFAFVDEIAAAGVGVVRADATNTSDIDNR